MAARDVARQVWALGACVAVLLALLAALTGCAAGAVHSASGSSSAPAGTAPAANARAAVQVTGLSFSRVSRTQIALTWSDALDAEVASYRVLRADAAADVDADASWACVAEVASDGAATGAAHTVVDELADDALRQYRYRVDVETLEPDAHRAEPGEAILASNALICVDPGHFAGANEVDDPAAPYCEGDFTLELARALADDLRRTCGIEVRLTRSTGDIAIDGYANGTLDGGHIALRGELAAGCDLFLSLHTNANLDNANGCPTFEQPLGITKPVVIANTCAAASPAALEVANAVGEELAAASARAGIATCAEFDTVAGAGELRTWSDAYNDEVNVPGTVYVRLRDDGASDYYGVLRGAAEVGVPGFIIEHGFHTVPAMRERAATGDLSGTWAAADARGIARGLGFVCENGGR